MSKQDIGLASIDAGPFGNLVALKAAALEATGNAILITDLAGTAVFVNPAFERLTGYAASEMVGQSTRVLRSGQNRPTLYKEMWKTILDGRTWRGELVNRRKNGSLYYEEMTITPVRNVQGGITHFVANKLDISDRRQAQANLLLLSERLSLATSVAKIGVWEWDLASNTFTWDATTFEIYGLPPVVAMPYEKWSTAVYPEDLPIVEGVLRKAIDERGQGSAEFRITAVDGTVKNVAAVGRAVLDEWSKVSRVLGVAQDVTERKRAELAVQQERNFSVAVVEGLPGLFYLAGEHGQMLRGNRALANASGYSAEEISHMSVLDFFKEPDKSRVAERMRQVFSKGEAFVEGALLAKDGTETPYLFTGKRLAFEGKPCMVGLGINIAERRRIEDQLRRLAAIVESSDDAIISETLDGTIATWNGGAERMYQYSSAETIGRSASMLLCPGQSNEVSGILERVKQGESVNHFETVRSQKGGNTINVDLTVSPISDATGKIVGASGIARDITARKQAEVRMVHLAQHDALTDLPNRVLLMDRLSQLAKASQRTSSKFAVVFIDLDRFKEVNDSLGHDVGDLLLQKLAKRFSSAVRAEDTCARIGGDEFVVLFQGLHKVHDAVLLAEKLASCLDEPVTLDGHELTVTASMGISIYPDDGTNGMEMLRSADAAMYQAKGAGRNSYQFYTDDLNQRAMEMLSIENALRRAIERQEFVLHYQPQVDFASGAVVGAEALIRWNHPELGLLMPVQFISIAEERGLIVPIGNWVIGEAARQAAVWGDSAKLSFPIALNVSAVQFRQKDFVEYLAESVRKHGIAPHLIELELTERIVMHDAETTIEILKRIHDLGFGLSIDDFGTGYSSLSYLRRFPIDKIKIDQSFVSDVTEDENAASIVNAIIGLARSLKLKVIAEGVQTKEQLELLRAQRCDQAQGFLFSPGLASREFEELVRQWKPKYL
jgi:diguanylate cyclase (GGDEF)-like protein/PAS domain S-box-containing protein